MSLATPSGRKVLMNPLSKWLAPVALLALLLVEVGTAWGQQDPDVFPTVTVTPASYTVDLQPSRPDETVSIYALLDPPGGTFTYEVAGPTVECTASGGPGLVIRGYFPLGGWRVTFTQADDGKTYTYTLIASNGAGVSKPATCTVTVKWNPAGGGGGVPTSLCLPTHSARSARIRGRFIVRGSLRGPRHPANPSPIARIHGWPCA